MSQRQTISDLAYSLWEARGCPQGSSTIDWEEAERQVKALSNSRAGGNPEVNGAVAPAAKLKEVSAELDAALSGTFPASDPVASQLSAEPPVNADEKWASAGKERKRKTRR